MNKPNKRKFERLSSKYALKCIRYPAKEDDAGIYVVCNDISANGIMFTSVVPFKVGEKLILSLKLSGWSNFLKKFHIKAENTDTYTTIAEVVRVKNIGDNIYHIATKLQKPSPAKQKALLEYIYKDKS